MNKKDGFSEQFRRKRKLALLLPVVFVPTICVAFYGLGGGKGDADGHAAGEIKGLNMTLPLAHFDSHAQPQDKMGFYEKAKQDSMRLQERKRQDPYVVDSGRRVTAGKAASGIAPIDGVSSERKVDDAMAKLEQLRQLVAKKAGLFRGEAGGDSGRVGVTAAADKGKEDRMAVKAEAELNGLVGQMKGVSGALGAAGASGALGGRDDPEMDRLDGMLDKLIRIQHPGLVRGDSSGAVAAGALGAAAVVSPPRAEGSMSSLTADVDGREEGGGFMEIGETDAGDTVRDETIEAVINSDQTLTAGSTVALRIVRDVSVNGRAVPTNQLVYGVAALSGERLMVSVSSIRVGEAIVPVSLQVYDLDGLAGIRVPGAITRDVSKESADQAVSGIEMASMDPSLSAQATSAGLAFARSLASRKLRLVRVSVPAGYRVLLKNSKSLMR